MEGGVSGWEFNGDFVLECFFLFIVEDGFDGLHVAGETGDGKEWPFV